MQNDEVPKLDLEAPKNGFPKWLLKLDSADAKPEKTVLCNYFKHRNKGSRGLPDMDCKQEVNSPWEMMQHMQKVHPWLGMNMEISTQYFEELIESLEDNYMEDLYEHDHMVSKQGKKIPKYPTIEWVIARSVTPEIGKNAESTNSSKDRITNNDVTSHVNNENFVDTATNTKECELLPNESADGDIKIDLRA